MIDYPPMSDRHKAKFTLTDASNLKSLDLPGLIAKRSHKKLPTAPRKREVHNKKRVANDR